MKKLYLIGSVIVFLLILVLVLPQFGAVGCTWVLVKTTTNPALLLMQATGLGIVLGGMLILFWKEMGKKDDMDDEEGGEAAA